MTKEDILPRSFGTHNGTFHADEVTACALLQCFDLIDDDKISRTRDYEFLKKCEYVCDVGGVYDPNLKRFDHHQVEYRGHLSSAGMILEYLKSIKIISQGTFEFFNNALVRGVDAHDNGRDPQSSGVCTFSHIISNYTPVSYNVDSQEQDAAFMRAKEFALGHLKRLWQRYQYNHASRETIIQAMADYKDCLIFDTAIPWMDVFFEEDGEKHPARFVIMPSGNHWKLRGIPPSADERMKVRMPFPESWAGLIDDSLKEETGIAGALFCHKGRFISVWATKEDALLALQKILHK